MALTEEKVVDQIEVVEPHAYVRVRTATVIKKDGVEINRSFHRHVLAPGDSLEGQDARVTAICNATWTDEVKSAYSDYLKSLPETPE
jgi:hypothetical protein|tara:strand:- start:659 stop:919 length:261 start_codon:yes stop_codon:yes gene_type:complete